MRIDVKVFTAPGKHIEPKALIPVFHGLIQRNAISDEVVIDVADYSHVVDGPGVMLVGHEGQYGYDLGKGKPGLLYSQRRARIEDTFVAGLHYGLRQVLRLAALLEKEESLRGKLELDAGNLLVRVNDRLRAPNTAQSAKRIEAEARSVLEPVFGVAPSIEPGPFGQELLTLQVRAGKSLRASALLPKL